MLVFAFSLFFPNIISLLIIWTFHTMHLDHTPPIPSTFEPSPEKRKQYTKSNLGFPYTHWDMAKLPVASPLKITESFHPPTPTRSHQLRRAMLVFPNEWYKAQSTSVCSLIFLQKYIVGLHPTHLKTWNLKRIKSFTIRHVRVARNLSLLPPQWAIFPREELCSEQLQKAWLCLFLCQISLLQSHCSLYVSQISCWAPMWPLIQIITSRAIFHKSHLACGMVVLTGRYF